MGLDIGDRRIGVALSDEQEIMAIPLTILERSDEEADYKAIAELARHHNVHRIVVGLPRSLDGSLGPQARKVQAFYQKLASLVDIPVVTWDERLSTVETDRILRETKVKHKKRKQRRDAIAASIILQTYLDSQRRR